MNRVSRIIAGGTLLLVFGGAGIGLAQTKEQVDRLNKWFEENQPKAWTPKVGAIQTPGVIRQPKGIQAIKIEEAKCERRFTVGADVLFAFDQWTLTPDAEETLVALGPILKQEGSHPARVEGHTDAKGSDEYNQTLSEKRARAVQEWLVVREYLPAATATQGYGEKRPIAPNNKPDGSDDPEGRQKNRRVEVIIDTCKKS